MKKLIAIVGPTATGKSSVAIALAKHCNGEIISADSAQVYRGLDIGTAKVNRQEQEEIPHHLLDIVGADTDYNIGLFQRDAEKAIAEISARGKLPVLCGGSGLYINSVINQGYDLGTASGNPQERERWLALEAEKGKGYLYTLLKERFPRRAEKIHPNDYQRILRGLEMEADLPKDTETLWKSPYDLGIFGLFRQRELLYNAIEKRIDTMVEAGLVEEVKAALAMGYREKGNALNALGYKEILPFLKGEMSLKEATELLKKNTRHFAKRQLTWFRRDPRIIWYDVDAYENTNGIAMDIYGKLKEDFFVL